MSLHQRANLPGIDVAHNDQAGPLGTVPSHHKSRGHIRVERAHRLDIPSERAPIRDALSVGQTA